MNPFDQDIFADGLPEADGIHDEVLDALTQHAQGLANGEARIQSFGRTTLLLAPRAGYGKSHLLSRLTDRVGDHGLFFPLNFNPELATSWSRLTRDLLMQLHITPWDGPERATLLDALARFYFGQMVMLGIREDVVKTADTKTSLDYVYRNYFTMFDPSGGEDSRAEWFNGAMDQILDAIAPDLAQTFCISESAACFWAGLFRKYTLAGEVSAGARSSLLREELGLPGDMYADLHSEAQGKERLCDLAQITSALRPVIFLVDHLDGFFGQQRAGMQIANILAEISRHVPRSLTLLSTNVDVWDSIFAQSIPSALEDRLSWDKRQLSALELEEADALIRLRLEKAGQTDETATAEFMEELNLPAIAARAREDSFTPRTLLRYARRVWDRLELENAASSDLSEEAAPAFKELKTPASEEAATPHVAAQAAPTASAVLLPDASVTSPVVISATEDPGEARITSMSFQTGATLAETFQRIRRSELEKTTLSYDPTRMRRLLSAVGKHFPAIQQSEVPVSESMNGQVLRWNTQRREILFGFASHSSYRFWQGLIRMAQERADGLTPERLKLVLFSTEEEPFPMGRLFVSQEQAALVSQFVDQVELDRELLGSIHAAEELLRQSSEGAVDFQPARVFGYLAAELDFFWRRLTRRQDVESPLTAAEPDQAAI